MPYVGPDLFPNCLTLMVFQQDCFGKKGGLGSVGRALDLGSRVASSSLTACEVYCVVSLSKALYPLLSAVQLRKTHLDMTEK